MQKRKQNYGRWINIISLMTIILLMLAACSPGTTSNPGAAPNTGGNQSIELMNTSFNPQQVTVKVGTTVVWTNKDSMAHTVTADDKSFDSGNLNPGQTFKFTFTKAGTYRYYCRYHGGPNGIGMSGTITVTGS